jgi:hypothetical protein
VAKRKSDKALERVLPYVRQDIDDAVDFITSEFEGDFEKSDRYFAGEVDIPAEIGRSQAVATVVRDSIRNLRPSIMRVLTSNRKRLVDYVPSNVTIANSVELQQAYVHQLFWANNGYRVLYDAIDESLKHRFGPVKTYWEPDPAPEFVRIGGLTLDEVQFLSEMPGVQILKIVPTDGEGEGDDRIEFYTVEAERQMSAGRIVMEAIPYGEFFISRNARTVKDARVHGHRRSVTVAEAIDMGLDFPNWWELDDDDPEQNQVAGQSSVRRGYDKHKEEDRSDVLSHRFLLTECMVQVDLEDSGWPQLYCVYFGGTSYKLLDDEDGGAACWREQESPFDVLCHDPRAFGMMGYSIADVTMDRQDVQTSLLRGILDNVHMTNNPRLAGNPQLVNFDDVMNWNISHPIRTRAQGTALQVIQIPSQVQAALPLLDHIEQDTQNQIGITKAAQGLDPNAMQSTDKQAVQNTIQLSQGQVELCVRNLIETGIIGIFRKLLRLSCQHMDRYQSVVTLGYVVTADQMLFMPDLQAQPQVGLGAVSDEQRAAGLQMTLQTQMMLMEKLGTDNPFVSMAKIYNTLEDLTEMFGLYNVSRYYNVVSPELEAQFAQQQAAKQAQIEAAKKGQVMDPALALIETEKIKAGTEKLKVIAQSRAKALELKLKALEIDSQDDLERDKMAQDRAMKSAEILGNTAVRVDQNQIKREQGAPRTAAAQAAVAAPTGGESTDA